MSRAGVVGHLAELECHHQLYFQRRESRTQIIKRPAQKHTVELYAAHAN